MAHPQITELTKHDIATRAVDPGVRRVDVYPLDGGGAILGVSFCDETSSVTRWPQSRECCDWIRAQAWATGRLTVHFGARVVPPGGASDPGVWVQQSDLDILHSPDHRPLQGMVRLDVSSHQQGRFQVQLVPAAQPVPRERSWVDELADDVRQVFGASTKRPARDVAEYAKSRIDVYADRVAATS